MARPKLFRRMINPPKIKGFSPYGDDVVEGTPVIILLEEYETLRLCDYELKNHTEAAEIMRVSRPTITRIYESARRKIALALTEGRAIIIEGGKVMIDNEWNQCLECGCFFNNTGKMKDSGICPLCGSRRIQLFDKKNKDKLHSVKNELITAGDKINCPVKS